MTDDDFDKVDEDFASEFDFVDTPQGTAAPVGGGDPTPGGQPPKSSAIVGLMVIISILGGGYFAYTKFFAKEPEAVTPPTEAQPVAGNDLPTLPEHTTSAPDLAATPMPTETSSKEDAANALADAMNKPTSDLSAALPSTSASEKSFEQIQKDLQISQTQAQTQPQAVQAEMRAALKSISEEMTLNVNNMQQLEGTISNMASVLDHLNNTINAMDNRVLSLTETVDNLSQDLANVKKIMIDQDLDLTMPGNNVKFSSKKQIQTLSSSEPNYSVHAIIPGRAWLKSASGQILTVTEGDKIGDYGTVAVIDAANGLVRTSSGIIIR